MTYEIVLNEERIPALVNELGDKVKVFKEWNNTGSFVVEITITNNLDLIKVFHAGIHHGMKKSLV